MFQRFLVTGVARVRHFPHDEHFHLLLKIERTPELQRFDLVRADPLAGNTARSGRPTASVALVMTQEQLSRKIIRRRTGAMSIGAALSVRNCAVLPVRSTQ